MNCMIQYKCPKCGRFWEDANPPRYPDMPPEERAEKICPTCAVMESRYRERPITVSREERLLEKPIVRLGETQSRRPEEYIAESIEILSAALNYVKNNDVRERIHEISRYLAVAYSFIISDNVEIYEGLWKIASGRKIILSKLGEEVLLSDEHRILCKVSEGPIKLEKPLTDRLADFLKKLLEKNIIEIYVIPRGWVMDKYLWFKDYRMSEEEDLTRARNAIEKVEENIKHIPQVFVETLKEKIKELRGML